VLTCHPYIDSAERRAGDGLTTQHMREHRADLIQRRDSAYEQAQRLEQIQATHTLTRTQATELNTALGQLSATGAAAEALSDQLITATTDRSGLYIPGAGAFGGGEYRQGQLLRNDQSVGEFVNGRGLGHGDNQQLDLGKLFRGMTGRGWANAEAEHRVLAEGAGSTGGVMVPTILSANLIDIVRNKARVIQAGAQTVVLESDLQTMARQATDPVLTWHTENAQITENGPTFDQITWVPQALPCLVRCSNELLMDTKADMHSVIVNTMTKAIALELDRVCLRGSGTAPEPKGIRNVSGVTITPLGTNGVTPTASASANTWDAVQVAARSLRSANFEPSSMLANARTVSEFAGLRDTQGRYLSPPSDVASIPFLDTSQILTTEVQGTSGAVASSIYLGQWDQLLLGIRSELQIQVLDQRYSDLYQTGFIAVLRADVALAHTAAFQIVSGIL
jgi:HK97 family phage major capsid protein